VGNGVGHGERNPRAPLIGTLAATALLQAVHALYIPIASRLWSSYVLIYGSLALAALLLSQGWLLGLITLLGGSLALPCKVMMIEGGSAQDAERRHVAHRAMA